MMNNIFEQLRDFKDEVITFYPGIKEELISEFEQNLELKLPDDYKEFLRISNGLELLSTTIYGISNNFEDLFEVYNREHKLVKVPMSKTILPFSPDGGGNFYCFDSETLTEKSCKVVFWTSNYPYTAEDPPEVCNDSFNDWVQEVVINWTKEDNSDVLK